MCRIFLQRIKLHLRVLPVSEIGKPWDTKELGRPPFQVAGEAAMDEQVTLSGSDHSDIVTLEPSVAEQGGEEDPSVAPGLQRMGTPSSSQYTFSTAESREQSRLASSIHSESACYGWDEAPIRHLTAARKPTVFAL